MQELDAKGIHFIGQQDGDVERAFTTKVSSSFEEAGDPVVAYLCRVHYGDPNDVNVALCIATPGEPNDDVLRGISTIFRGMFGAHEHLDMIFVNEEQELRLREVCKPFHPKQ